MSKYSDYVEKFQEADRIKLTTKYDEPDTEYRARLRPDGKIEIKQHCETGLEMTILMDYQGVHQFLQWGRDIFKEC